MINSIFFVLRIKIHRKCLKDLSRAADSDLICLSQMIMRTLSGYHADTPITIKAEPFIWPTAALINIHEHPI